MNNKHLRALEAVPPNDDHRFTTSRMKRVINPSVVLILGSMSLLRPAPAKATSPPRSALKP
jgi:hypothetical protein